ncbi:MAG: stringent starvation protein B [Gammaproteobacteria bacterium]|jgi:stringent starvation protein B
MTPSKPYLIRGLYEWLLDNEVTPYLLVDTSFYGVMIPQGIATDGKVVLNLAPSAIQQLELDNEYIAFSARFGGVAQNVYCPMGSILAIYAKENGEGTMFNEESSADVEAKPEKKTKSKKPVRPGLTIVK